VSCDDKCAEVSTAKQIDVSIKTVVPNDIVGVFSTQNGYTEILNHENRRRSVYKKAHDAYIEVVSSNGRLATQCGKVCFSQKGEAKEKLLNYLDQLQTAAISNFNSWVQQEQLQVGNESLASNTKWSLVNGKRLLDGFFQIHAVGTPPAMTKIDCPK
jgi:hypothetical protein